jgi:hypothetical protein
MTAPESPNKIEEALVRLRRAEAAMNRTEKVGKALRIAFFAIWLYLLWSCRDGCSENSWFLVGAYPLFVLLYMVKRRRATRRILSELHAGQLTIGLPKQPRELGPFMRWTSAIVGCFLVACSIGLSVIAFLALRDQGVERLAAWGDAMLFLFYALGGGTLGVMLLAAARTGKDPFSRWEV